MQKKTKKLTKKKIKKNLRRLKNKALKLWALVVKAKAHNKCCVPGCNNVERLNAHHIESYSTCKSLRYDIKNGLCLCSGHHKFFADSPHKSFCFTIALLTPDIINYLTIHRKDTVEFTEEYYENKIKELQQIIDTCKSQ